MRDPEGGLASWPLAGSKMPDTVAWLWGWTEQGCSENLSERVTHRQILLLFGRRNTGLSLCLNGYIYVEIMCSLCPYTPYFSYNEYES